MCYPEDEHESSCPITEILFRSADNIAEYQADPAMYTIKPFSWAGEDLYLVYSKTSTDNLPIVTTSAESGRPCAHPGELSQPSYDLYYPLEIDRKRSDCTMDLSSGTNVDNRFYDTGTWVTEYEVQQASGVLAVLTRMPLYT